MDAHPLEPFVKTTAEATKLAGKADCSVTHLLNIRAGRKNASLPLAKRLSDATGLRMEAFLRREPVQAPA